MIKTPSTIKRCLNAFLTIILCSSSIHESRAVDGGVLTEEDKQALLDLHNTKRSETALGNTPGEPMAKNMVKLVWDEDLEDDAKAYANNCVFAHDPSNQVQGENLYTAGSVHDDIDNIDNLLDGMELWYEEHTDYIFDTQECIGDQCGHYTQMAWGDTQKMGCGYSECTTIFGGQVPYQLLLVCRYSPKGNFVGMTPYEKASTSSEIASDCPSGFMAEASSGLCIIDENFVAPPTNAPNTVVVIIPICRTSRKMKKLIDSVLSWRI